MDFNPQEPLTILNGDDRDIIYKCIEIAIKETNNSKRKLLYELVGFILSLDRTYNEQNGYGDDTVIKLFKDCHIDNFYRYCDDYGIEKEYRKYISILEFCIYVELYKISIEHNICGLKHPAEKIKELARYKYLIENPIFRGKHIELSIKIVEDKEVSLVFYDNKEYKFDDFLITMYPDKRINKSVVYFPDTIDNLLKIGPTQRIKMKYDILAYHFGLPIIDEEEKEDLFRFLSKYYENKTIQKYYRRFNWDYGLEKMVAFGADLDISGKVDGAIEDFFCYKYRTEKDKAFISGIDMSLYNWIIGVKAELSSIFEVYQSRENIPGIKGREIIYKSCLMLLYCQQGNRIALPDTYIGRPIKEVINSCIDILCRKMKSDKSIDISSIVNNCFSTISIPDYQSEVYQFTVDFEKDIMIVDTKSAARVQQAIEQVYTIAAERLTGLKTNDKVTTKQLRDRGYKNNNGKAINTLVEYGILQKGVLRGSYIMLKDF